MGSSSPKDDLQTVGRAFAVMELLAEKPLRASSVARALEIKWATAHRMLAYLTRMGYLERDPGTNTYSVGVRAYSLGSSYVARLALHATSRPYLEAASEMANATAQLVKRDHRRSVVLSVFEARRDHIPETTVGCNFPLHCGSKGHVLLAYADAAFLEAYLQGTLERLTPKSIVDPELLEQRFERVRERGFAVTDGDVRMFSSSVAAPIFDRSNSVVAAITLVVRPTELKAREAQLVETVVRAANGVSRLLKNPTRPTLREG